MVRLKFCLDCRWSLPSYSRRDYNVALCTNPEVNMYDPKYLANDYFGKMCHKARGEGESCGLEGNLWESNQ